MSQCTTCHAGCCRTYVVPITGADILRIMSSTAHCFSDFVSRWADPEGAIARTYVPQFYFQDCPEMPFVIALRHEPSSHFPGTMRCRFLVEGEQSSGHPLGIAQCGIYGDRPSACRAYPTRFDSAAQLAVLCDIPPAGNESGHPVYQLCPRKWEPADLDPIQHVQDLAVSRYEMGFYFELASAWNARPGEWRLFPEFLRMVYSRRIISADAERQGETPPAGDPIVQFPRIAA